MKYLLIFSIFITGCVCLDPAHKKSGPPIAKTEEVIESLEKTKTELDKAGESNTIVGEKVGAALTLAEKLEKLLEQIDVENNKNLKEPIK